MAAFSSSEVSAGEVRKGAEGGRAYVEATFTIELGRAEVSDHWTCRQREGERERGREGEREGGREGGREGEGEGERERERGREREGEGEREREGEREGRE